MPTRRRVAELIAIAALSLPLTACGGDQPTTAGAGESAGGGADRCSAIVAATADGSSSDRHNAERRCEEGGDSEAVISEMTSRCYRYAHRAWNSDGIPDEGAKLEAADACEKASGVPDPTAAGQTPLDSSAGNDADGSTRADDPNDPNYRLEHPAGSDSLPPECEPPPC